MFTLALSQVRDGQAGKLPSTRQIYTHIHPCCISHLCQPPLCCLKNLPDLHYKRERDVTQRDVNSSHPLFLHHGGERYGGSGGCPGQRGALAQLWYTALYQESYPDFKDPPCFPVLRFKHALTSSVPFQEAYLTLIRYWARLMLAADPVMVTCRSEEPSTGLAILICAPDIWRISLILAPWRPMIQPIS